MTDEPSQRPTGDGEPDLGPSSPHLVDYWQVIARRLWLVLLIFGVTTASAIWAVSRQRTYYQAHLSLQVNDPMQRTRSLTPGTRVSSREFFVDPIQSEIEVLRSSPIALEVVKELGMRLVPRDEERVRSSLMREIEIYEEAVEGSYRLVYDDGGQTVTLRGPGGEALGSAPVGSVLDAGTIRFVPQPAPAEQRAYALSLVPAQNVVGEVRNNVSAGPRENTNIIDVTYTSADPVLAPKILNAAGDALREYGARKVSVAASQDVNFIEEQLDSARQQLSRSLQAIRQFKETRAFTNLSLQEQQLVNQIQQVTSQVDTLERQRSTLSDLSRRMERRGIGQIDLVNVLAELPGGANPQIRDLVSQIQERQSEIQELLTQRRLTEDHPRVQALRSQIGDLEGELREAVDANLRAIEGRLETLNRRLGDLREEQKRFPELENRLQTLELQQNLDQSTYEFLLSQLYQARITEAAASPYVDIVDPALGANPMQPRGRMNVFLGALLGLILGIGAAFFLEYLDRTVRTSSDVEALLGIPVLGIIPRLRRVEEEEDEEQSRPRRHVPLVVALDPLDPAAESYRNLRMNLNFMSTEDDPIRTLLVTSPGPGEGKSTTAVNYAVMLAQQGERVLMIDADLRRPAMHRALDLLREPGLTNLLVGDVEPREAVRPNVLPNMDVLPSGPFPPNPSELLNSKSMQRILEEFQGKYTQIVIDSPPVLAVTDSSVLAVHTDGVVLVLRSGETEQRAAERAVDQLRRLGVRVFGAVLNEVSTATTEESYYLQYYYSYEPEEKEGLGKLREGISKARFW